jgi:hypothetical protein
MADAVKTYSGYVLDAIDKITAALGWLNSADGDYAIQRDGLPYGDLHNVRHDLLCRLLGSEQLAYEIGHVLSDSGERIRYVLKQSNLID